MRVEQPHRARKRRDIGEVEPGRHSALRVTLVRKLDMGTLTGHRAVPEVCDPTAARQTAASDPSVRTDSRSGMAICHVITIVGARQETRNVTIMGGRQGTRGMVRDGLRQGDGEGLEKSRANTYELYTYV